MIRTAIGSTLLCAAFSCVAFGQTAPTQRAQKPATVVAAPECDCSVLPWKPNPPCPKQCSGLVIGGTSVVKLRTTFQLSPEVVKAVEGVKSDGVTPKKLDTFLLSPEGKTFMKAVEAKPAAAKVLAESAKDN